MKRWLIIVLVVAVAVIVGVAGVFGGRASAATPSPQEAAKVLSNLTAQQRQQLAQSGGLSAAFGGSRGTGTGSGSGGFTTGSIVSSDSNSVTIKLSDGSTKIVIYAPSTAITVSKAGSAGDLTAGQTVTVTGTANSDGSITATRIQVGAVPRPAGSTTGGTGASGSTAGTGQSATASTVPQAGTGGTTGGTGSSTQ